MVVLLWHGIVFATIVPLCYGAGKHAPYGIVEHFTASVPDTRKGRPYGAVDDFAAAFVGRPLAAAAFWVIWAINKMR